MAEEKNEDKAFSMRLDPHLRMEFRAVALKHGMTMKQAVERMFRLFVEADGVENLERLYRENRK